MWKRVLALSLVLAVMMGIAAQAAPARAPRLYPSLEMSRKVEP